MADETGEARRRRDTIINEINQKICDHRVVNISDCSIFKVPNPLREIKEKAYEPQVVAIGPYHDGKEHLKAMEVQKMTCLKFFLREEGDVERYVTELEQMEGRIRGFYSENLDHSDGELIDMMLRDGFFIIWLIIDGRRERDLTPFILRMVMRDLVLVENQLPFFVLFEFWSLYKYRGRPLSEAEKDVILKSVIDFFRAMMPRLLIEARTGSQDTKHILDLLRFNSSERIEIYMPPRLVTMALEAPRMSRTRNWHFIRTATELNEAGIKIQKKEEGELFDIDFQKEVMSIPILKIEDDTECVFRNLVAYEQCYRYASSKPFTDYFTFMDCLINTGKDVELLCRRGVLDNWLGDDEVVATMFNRLRDSVLLSEENFTYKDIFKRVNEHCDRKWNLWKANLWHNYFNTPWALISFIAAVVVLLSTLLQTLFSVLSYGH